MKQLKVRIVFQRRLLKIL